ncbi:MAG: Ni/Fe-hydrogenase cytochrome b subunit [Dehalococcoidales bacterium]|nr:MAG: Ni/Fe-hydrogenase cytochrome b subunit [Dehalococcoidales bacterium]
MKINKRSIPVGTLILTTVVLIGLITMILRYINGLGATTNLSDGRAWGLWISFDLYCGVALAAGGFTLAGIVYIFRREKYHAVARPAILTAFLGYTLVILALLVDLGQPWYIWRFLFNWNIHSPMFEVSLCVMTYTIVLALEFSPVVFEALSKSDLPIIKRFKWQIPMRIIRAIQIPLVIAGIVLSTLHQSSLGSMLLMMPETLHTLWYTPILPILFLNSAIAVGPAMVMFESTLSSRVFGHRLSLDIFSGLGKMTAYILSVYLLLKIVDLLARGDLTLIFTAYPENLLWWGEMVIGAILPIVLFSMPSVRQSRTWLFWTATLVVVGLIFNRFNVSMLALGIRPDFTYFPYWMEFAVSAGLVADAMLVIWLANRLLPMGPGNKEGAITEAGSN